MYGPTLGKAQEVHKVFGYISNGSQFLYSTVFDWYSTVLRVNNMTKLSECMVPIAQYHNDTFSISKKENTK